MMDIYAEIRKRYGNVRRARGYYLYTEKNVRLLDLWLDGGKAILGRRTGQANLVCKQFLDKGLTGFLPTKADAQLRHALESLLPDYPVIRWYTTRERAEQIAGSALQSYRKDVVQQLPVWRPFLGIDTGGENGIATEAVPITLVTPAYPVPCGIIAADSRFEASLPPSDALFPPLAYSLARAFFDLKRKIDELQIDTEPVQNGKTVGRSARISHTIAKRRQATLNRKTEAERLIPCVWAQKGWYLFPHISEAEYPTLFIQALDAHVLISPEYGTPSILPDCESYTELIRFLKSRNG